MRVLIVVAICLLGAFFASGCNDDDFNPDALGSSQDLSASVDAAVDFGGTLDFSAPADLSSAVPDEGTD